MNRIADNLKATVLVPLYNDWEAVSILLKNLDSLVPQLCLESIDVLLIDDASTHVQSPSFRSLVLNNISKVEILRLSRNLGHQRAIAVGLVHICKHNESDVTIIMDSDGEDNPADIEKLLRAVKENALQKVVFAERTIRSEGLVFYIFYQLYRFINWILTGCKIRFGNFSAVPRPALKSLVTVSELWNHYAASVVSSKVQYTLVPTARKKRYSGQSKMNFIGLVTHGLSAIAVHREIVSTRILMMITFGGIIAACFLTGVIFFGGAQLELSFSLLGIGIILALLVQMLSIVLSLVFLVLGNRDNATFLPIRDCDFFIEKIDLILFNGNEP